MTGPPRTKTESRRSSPLWTLVLVGFAAGLLSGLLGVGGGIVMVPLLVLLMRVSQHEAHATSLAAILPIAIAGAGRFGVAGQIDIGVALLLGAGALVGAPVGARLMARSAERTLKSAFGVLMLVVGMLMVVS